MTVVVRPSGNPQRERFTLAHELGHIQIPWHLPLSSGGSCHIDEDAQPDLEGMGDERQADLFASCLLMPDRWLRPLIDGFNTDMDGLLREVEVADLSTVALIHGMRRFLMPGWVLAAYPRGRGKFGLVYPSRGTVLNSEINDIGALEAAAVERGECELNGYPVRWFRMFEEGEFPEVDDNVDRHVLLMSVLGRLYPRGEDAIKMAQRVNGVVGGTLNNHRGRAPEALFGALQHKVVAHGWDALLGEPDFIRWIALKARDISAGATKKGQMGGPK